MQKICDVFSSASSVQLSQSVPVATTEKRKMEPSPQVRIQRSGRFHRGEGKRCACARFPAEARILPDARGVAWPRRVPLFPEIRALGDGQCRSSDCQLNDRSRRRPALDIARVFSKQSQGHALHPASFPRPQHGGLTTRSARQCLVLSIQGLRPVCRPLGLLWSVHRVLPISLSFSAGQAPLRRPRGLMASDARRQEDNRRPAVRKEASFWNRKHGRLPRY